MENPNGSPTMKATKNPKKLNTSFWETLNKDEAKPVKKKKKGRKKKKTKMTAMWENKFEEDKKKVDSTSYKPKPKPVSDDVKTIEKRAEQTTDETNGTNVDASVQSSSSPVTPLSTEADDTENIDINAYAPAAVTTDENVKNKPKPKAKTSSKIGALAGRLNINPMGLRGGIPPSLRKKREEAKEKGVELPSQQFERPTIPQSVHRKKATKDDILAITSNEIKLALSEYLSQSFVFDECMVLKETLLCLYLRDFAGIDLSLIGDNEWDTDILIESIHEVFGEKAQHEYGYQLRIK